MNYHLIKGHVKNDYSPLNQFYELLKKLKVMGGDSLYIIYLHKLSIVTITRIEVQPYHIY